MPDHDTPTKYPNWKESVTFDDHGPSPTTILETDHLKAVLVGLKAGQAIPIHPSPEAVYHFMQGTGTMTVDDETFTIQPGITITTPTGSRRGIDAATDIVFLGTTRPASHETTNETR